MNSAATHVNEGCARKSRASLQLQAESIGSGPTGTGSIRRQVSKPQTEPDLGLEVINRIVFDYGHANLERKREIVCDLASDPCVERKEQSPGLSGDRVPVVDPDVRARI